MRRYDDYYDSYDRYGGNTKLHVGRLSSRTQTRDLEVIFSRYGRVRSVNLKYDYGFVEFYDPRDACDAKYKLDGREIDGSHIIVSFAKGSPRGSGGSRDYVGRGRPPPGSRRCLNSGVEGHRARHCNSVDLRNKCYRCGEIGHIESVCHSSPKNFKRGRSHSRSPSSRRGRSRNGQSYSRDGRGAGPEKRLSPRRDGPGAGNQERLASSSKGRNQSLTPNVMSSPQTVQAEHNGNHGGSPRRGDHRSPCPAHRSPPAASPRD